MRKRKFEILIYFCVLACLSVCGGAGPAGTAVKTGNDLYEAGKYDQAGEIYDKILEEAPQIWPVKYNKANTCFKLGEYDEAIELYKQSASNSEDMDIVARSNYNLGNSFFRRGDVGKISDAQKAIDDYETAISYWRKNLAVSSDNINSARNIELARLRIKELRQQMQNQQQNDQNDQNEDEDQSEQSQDNGQDSQENQDKEQEQDKQQSESEQQKNEEAGQENKNNQQQPEQNPDDESEQRQDFEQKQAPDTTAMEILEQEMENKDKRQKVRVDGYQKVEKDW